MTTGDESQASANQDAALDDDAAPDTGIEPDTAADAAGEQELAGSDDGEPTSQADQKSVGTRADQQADADVDSTSQQGGGQSVVLDGPAAENEEMRRGTSDLQSSVEKSAAARKIFDDLQRTVLPESTEH